MRAAVILVAGVLAACGSAPEASRTAAPTAVVRVSLPDEPTAAWTGQGGAVIARNCVACHSPEMIATQPHLGADTWQATIDKMRTVYHAPIDKADDAALVAALQAMQAAPAQPD